MGWEIGLIGDSLFPENDQPDYAAFVPVGEAEPAPTAAAEKDKTSAASFPAAAAEKDKAATASFPSAGNEADRAGFEPGKKVSAKDSQEPSSSSVEDLFQREPLQTGTNVWTTEGDSVSPAKKTDESPPMGSLPDDAARSEGKRRDGTPLSGESAAPPDVPNLAGDRVPGPPASESAPDEDFLRKSLPCETEEESKGVLGQPGLRFCWEITKCENLQCPVRQRRIIRCFKFFEPRGTAAKLVVTGGTTVCDQCYVKQGWDLGMIHEGLFEDILAERVRKNRQADRISKETIVGIYLQELSKKPLSKDEEMALARRIAGDKHAAELFLMANLKLVVRIAGSFGNRGLNILDLIQEGNLGLIKAISKFDYTLGYKFSTYAAYWVRHYMQKAVSEQGRTIRVPHHLLVVAHKIRKTIGEQQVILGRSPTLSELAALLNLEEDKILSVIRITETPISIEAKSNEDDGEDNHPDYFLADKMHLSPEEEALERSKAEACREALDLLPDRLREVIELFYGFRDAAVSLAEIGRRMGFTRERARQLLREALQELEKKEFVAQLKEYL
ncbi:MAG: RNA polymerase sigma factor RpoD/SigA [Candidatus Ozemobacteraceae bacterium]